MSTRENNLQTLKENEYGVEEELTKNMYSPVRIHLYSPKFLYIDHFDNHEDLALWIKNNIKN